MFFEKAFRTDGPTDLRTYGRTYGPTDGRTDRPSYRDARTHLKRACNKAGINLVTKPGNKLKDVLCSGNKTRHDPNNKPGVYKIHCPCSPSAIYIGQTIRPINIRGKEHERAANTGNWNHSGISQHKQGCPELVNWELEVITTMTNKNK